MRSNYSSITLFRYTRRRHSFEVMLLRCSLECPSPFIYFDKYTKPHHWLRLQRRLFSQEGCPFPNKPADPRVVYGSGPSASFVTRENASYDDDPKDEERAKDADRRRFACLSFVSGLFTPKVPIADKGCSHVFFFLSCEVEW